MSRCSPGMLTAGLDHPVLQVEIAEVRVHELRFTIAPALRLPRGRVGTREYVVLEVVLASGSTGTAYVLTRGAPLYEAADNLASRLVGKPLRRAVASSATQRGISPGQRASALADICAWDLGGKAASVPTWQLIGKHAGRRKVLAVAGYRRSGETPKDFSSRLCRLAHEGIRAVKIADGEKGDTRQLLTAVRASRVGEGLDLVVDMGCAGESVDEVLASVEAWRPYSLDWVEDPFASTNVRALAELRAAMPTGTLLAAGDEAPPSELLRMLEYDAIDLLRLDVTTTGGITGLVNLVAQSDHRVSFHIYPEVHRHIACVLPEVEEIELFLPRDPFDFVDQFIKADTMEVADGYLLPPHKPGLGFAFAPDGIARHITRSSRHNAVSGSRKHRRTKP